MPLTYERHGHDLIDTKLRRQLYGLGTLFSQCTQCISAIYCSIHPQAEHFNKCLYDAVIFLSTLAAVQIRICGRHDGWGIE